MNEPEDEGGDQPPVTDGCRNSGPPEGSKRYVPAEEWDVDRPDDPESLDSLWIRWTDGGSDLQFHRVCEVFPQLIFSHSWPFIQARPEGHKPPVFRPVREEQEDPAKDEIQFKFVSGLPRQLLRHVPLVILLATFVMFVTPEVIPTLDINGWSAILPQFTSRDGILLGLFLGTLPVLIWLLTKVEVIEIRDLSSAGITYGLIGFLAAGILTSLFLTAMAEHPNQVEPNVVLTAGYLLTLLLGGMILYEATLRIEHLFVRLKDRDKDIIDNHKAYRRFLTDLHDALNERRILGLIHPSRLFGVVFALQFLLVWTIGSGPQNLNYSIGMVVNFALNAVLVTVVFKFFILVRYFNLLMNEKKKYGEIGIHYEPFHIDGYGGFRDFGRFATRINIILTLAGLYLVYRLYITGGLKFPTEGFAGFTDPLELTIWSINFIGPVVAYALGAAAWGYYSFWSMHVKMERDKQMLARKYQGERGNWDLDRVPSAGDTIDSFEDCNGPEWDAFRSAPTWPVDVNKMLSLFSSNALPLLLPVFNLFL